MNLKNYIESGIEKAGSVTALSQAIGTTRETTSRAKSHKYQLPIDAVVKLASYIDEDLQVVIAANELVTERKENKVIFWRGIVEKAGRATAALLLCVTIFMTPYAEAASSRGEIAQKTNNYKLCVLFIML